MAHPTPYHARHEAPDLAADRRPAGGRCRVRAPAAADTPSDPAAKGKLGDERLSDEKTLTRIGWPMRIFKVRSGPGTTYRTVDKLRFYTEDGAPENYLVLRSKLDAKKRPWLQIRIPRRPNGSKGWVPRYALRMRVRTTSLEIDKGALKARLFDEGREGGPRASGSGRRLPPRPRAGRYWIRERLPNLGGNAAYGPPPFGTAVVLAPVGAARRRRGSASTARTLPSLIPGRPSHGCTASRNDKISRWTRLMPVGTPVWIHD